MQKYLLGIAICLSACAPKEKVPPTPPDLSETLATFASPTGELTPETAQALVTNFASLTTTVELVIEVISLVENAMEGFEKDGMDTTQSALLREQGLAQSRKAQVAANASAWLRLTYLCGPRSELAQKMNGDLVLTTLGEVGAPTGPIWGNLNQCHLNDSSETRINGAIALLVQRGDENPGTYVTLDARANSGDGTKTLGFEARLTSDSIEFLDRVDGNSFVLSFPLEPSLVIGVRDKDGLWSCDSTESRCTRGDTGMDISW